MMLRAITKKYVKLLISVTLIASLGFSLAWGLSSGYASLAKSLNSYVTNYGYPDGYITTEVTSTADAEKVLAVDGIRDCDTRLCADTVMKTAAGDIYSVRVFSYSAGEEQSFYRWSDKEDVEDGILLEYHFAVSNNISAGDVVYFRVRGEYRAYVVEGIVSRPETLSAKISDNAWGINYDFGYVYAPSSLLQKEYEKDYAESKGQLDEKSDELSAEKTSALDLLDKKEKELNDAKELLKEKRKEYLDSKSAAEDIIAQLSDTKAELIASSNELTEKFSELSEAYDLAAETQAALKEQSEKLYEARAALEEIDAAVKKLEEAQNALNSESVRGLIQLLALLPKNTGMSVLLDNALILSDYLSRAEENGFSYDISKPLSVLDDAIKSFIDQTDADLSYLTSKEVKELIDHADAFSAQDERYSKLVSVLRRYSLSRVTDAESLRKTYQTTVSNLTLLSEQAKQPQVHLALKQFKSIGTDRSLKELLDKISDIRSELSILSGDKPIEQMTVGEVGEQYYKALTDTADLLRTLNESRQSIIAELGAYGVDESSLSDTIKELEDGIIAAGEAMTDLEEARIALSNGLDEINDGIAEIDSAVDRINRELSDGQSQLGSAEKEISQGETELAGAAKELKTFSDLEKELKNAYEKLEEGEGYDKLCNQFLIYMDENADADAVMENAVKALDSSGVKSSYTYEDSPVKKRIDSNLDPLSTLMSLLPAIFFVIVLIVVFLFMSMIIHQSRRDIGILMALGIGKGSIRTMFCMLGAGVALVGMIIGSGVGLLLRGYVGGYFERFFPLPEFSYSPDIGGFFLSAAATVAVCTSAALLGTVMISRVTPKEAMSRPVQPRLRIPVLLECLTRKLSPMLKFSITSLLRNKGRFLFSTICVAASVMLIFTSVSFIASKNYVITQTFDERIRYDCQMFFEDEPSEQVLDGLEKLDGVAGCESVLMYELTVSSDKASEKASVYAISPDNGMIGISDVSGAPLAVKPGEIIIERHLADTLGVKAGDRVTVKAKEMTVGGVTDQCVNRVQYIPIEEAKVFGKPELYSVLCRFDAQPRHQLLSYLTECEGYLYSVFTESLFAYNKQLYATYDLAAWILILFAVLVGFIIVFNTAITNLQDNKRELCVLRTLGFQHREISTSRFSQSLLQFVIAGVIGLIPGIALAKFTLLKISTATEEFAYAAGVKEMLLVLAIVFLYITASHFSAMRTMKKWDHIVAVKDRE